MAPVAAADIEVAAVAALEQESVLLRVVKEGYSRHGGGSGSRGAGSVGEHGVNDVYNTVVDEDVGADNLGGDGSRGHVHTSGVGGEGDGLASKRGRLEAVADERGVDSGAVDDVVLEHGRDDRRVERADDRGNSSKGSVAGGEDGKSSGVVGGGGEASELDRANERGEASGGSGGRDESGDAERSQCELVSPCRGERRGRGLERRKVKIFELT